MKKLAITFAALAGLLVLGLVVFGDRDIAAEALVEKYGVVPQWCMQRCQSEDGTRELNGVLERLLRQAAHEVRSALARRQPAEAAIRSALGKVRTVLVTHYGPPPESFRMRWRDDDQLGHHLSEGLAV